MTFREIKIRELLDFIASDFYKSSAVIPISPQRAISQYNNPNSKSTDVALILALDKNESIIGYIGILPGKISIESTPYFWNSCWWVDAKKGKIAAMPLFYKMLQLSNQKMVFFELTETTKKIVEKLNFQTKKENGFKGFFKFNFTEILPRKNNAFNIVKPLLQISDWILNGFIGFKLSSWKNIENTQLTSISEIDNEAEQFINQFNSEQLIPTDKQELNWILKYPWINSHPTPEDKKLANKYFFSSISNSFSNELFKVYNNKLLIGVLFFTIRDNEMKIPYVFYDEKNSSAIMEAVYNIAIKHHVISFTTFNSNLIYEIKNNKNPFIITKSLTKNIAFPINLKLGNKKIQDGNGDAVFC